MKTVFIDDLNFGDRFSYIYENSQPIHAMKVDGSNFDLDDCNAVDLETGELFGIDCDEPLIILKELE